MASDPDVVGHGQGATVSDDVMHAHVRVAHPRMKHVHACHQPSLRGSHMQGNVALERGWRSIVCSLVEFRHDRRSANQIALFRGFQKDEHGPAI